MCYDISFKSTIKQMGKYFPTAIMDDQLAIDFELLHNFTHIVGHAYGEHPIFYIPTTEDIPHCKFMEWGIIPFYIKDEDAFKKQRPTMLNIRSERILDDPKSYWYKIKNRRCLVPITGFYEHRDVEGFTKKIPYYLGLKSQPLFFIPGLYSVAELPDKQTGEMIKRYTYGLITRPANELMKLVHNGGENKWRMPLMLPFELSKTWLQKEVSEPVIREILNYEMPPAEISYHTVFTIRSNKARSDDKEKDSFYQWENLPDLVLQNQNIQQ